MKTVQFTLDNKNGVPFYRQIIQQIEFSISSGALRAGDKLPTVRQLAVDLMVNPNTVARAYSELEIRGFVVTQVGSGTFISDREVEISEIERIKKMDELCARFFTECNAVGYNRQDAIKYLKKFGEADDAF